MKKLFVLFLLVALVPFTVGCSLWGHDEDLDVLPTTWTVKVTDPANLGSVRAAAPVVGDAYYGYYITINGVTLNLTDVTGSVFTFSKAMTDSTDLAKMNLAAGTEYPIIVYDATGTAQKAITIISNVALSGNVAVDLTTATNPAVTVGTTSVAAVAVNPTTLVATNVDTIASVTGLDGVTVVPLNGTTAATVASASGKLTFTVTATAKTFDITKPYAYVVKVNGKAVSSTDFTLSQTAEQKTAKQAVITLDSTKRVAGTTYTVVIETLVVDGIDVTGTTFMFKFK